jgi:hypothetical protein
MVRAAAGSDRHAVADRLHRRPSRSTRTAIVPGVAPAVMTSPSRGAVRGPAVVAFRPRPPVNQPLADNPGRPAVADQPVGRLRPKPPFEPFPVNWSLGRQRRRPPPRFTFDEGHRHVRPLQRRQVLEQLAVFGPWRPADDTVSSAARSVREIADDRGGPRRVVADDQPLDIGHDPKSSPWSPSTAIRTRNRPLDVG